MVRLSCAVAIVSFICRVWDLDLDGLIIIVEKLARLGQITHNTSVLGSLCWYIIYTYILYYDVVINYS